MTWLIVSVNYVIILAMTIFESPTKFRRLNTLPSTPCPYVASTPKERWEKSINHIRELVRGLHKQPKGKMLHSGSWREFANPKHHYIEDILKGNPPRRVTYYHFEQSRKEFLITVGKSLRKSNGKPLKGTNMFVISLDYKLYAGVCKRGEFQHSSFLAGAPVLACGDLITDRDGKLKAITNESGHYKPGVAQMENAKWFFMRKGIDISKVNCQLHSH